ncbi:MAG: hypothetical protein Q9166_007658 [cf. Caloplaca sp. 2 TL-2023]
MEAETLTERLNTTVQQFHSFPAELLSLKERMKDVELQLKIKSVEAQDLADELARSREQLRGQMQASRIFTALHEQNMRGRSRPKGQPSPFDLLEQDTKTEDTSHGPQFLRRGSSERRSISSNAPRRRSLGFSPTTASSHRKQAQDDGSDKNNRGDNLFGDKAQFLVKGEPNRSTSLMEKELTENASELPPRPTSEAGITTNLFHDFPRQSLGLSAASPVAQTSSFAQAVRLGKPAELTNSSSRNLQQQQRRLYGEEAPLPPDFIHPTPVSKANVRDNKEQEHPRTPHPVGLTDPTSLSTRAEAVRGSLQDSTKGVKDVSSAPSAMTPSHAKEGKDVTSVPNAKAPIAQPSSTLNPDEWPKAHDVTKKSKKGKKNAPQSSETVEPSSRVGDSKATAPTAAPILGSSGKNNQSVPSSHGIQVPDQATNSQAAINPESAKDNTKPAPSSIVINKESEPSKSKSTVAVKLEEL